MPFPQNNASRRPRAVAEVLALTVLLMFLAATIPHSALADGDPASDVLATQSLFLPQDAGISPEQQGQLAGLLQAADRAGYPIRVALIASRSDLGSVTALWRQPQRYAEFLGEELSLVYHGPLLVVMPDGFGFMWPSHSTPGGASTLAGLHVPASGTALETAAVSAVQRLAGAAGYSVSVPAGRVVGAAPGSSDGMEWIVVALGGLLIAVAWTASFRARPLRFRRRGVSI